MLKFTFNDDSAEAIVNIAASIQGSSLANTDWLGSSGRPMGQLRRTGPFFVFFHIQFLIRKITISIFYYSTRAAPPRSPCHRHAIGMT